MPRRGTADPVRERLLRGPWGLSALIALSGGCALTACAPDPPRFELTPAQARAVDAATPDERPTPTHSTPVEWDDSVRLLGWDTELARPSPGDRFDLTLAWESLRPVRKDWEVHMRLKPSWAGREAVLDHHTAGGLHPVMRWTAGQFVLDRLAVRLPGGFAPGPAELFVGLAYRGERRGPVSVGHLDVRPTSQLVLHVPGKARWRLDADTVVWGQWHSDGLTFGFELRDADPWNPLRGRDADLWKYDVVEVFLDVDETDPAYVELQVSPTGALFDAAFTDRRSDLAIARAWDSGASAIAMPTPAGWRAELFIPWARLPARALDLSPIRANFYRIDRDRSGRRRAAAWSGPASGDFHDRRRWGRLLLAP